MDTATLASIEEIYWNPITEPGQVRMDWMDQLEAQQQAGEATKYAAERIDEIWEELRSREKDPSAFPKNSLQLNADQAQSLRERIKEDEIWREFFYDIVKSVAPALATTHLEDLLEAINLPWWNKGLVFRRSSEELDDYESKDPTTNEPSLVVPAKLSHSYITQLKRAKKLPATNDDSASISNVLLTADGLLVLGYRVGQSYPHTLMTIPAGSVDYHTGRNPLFETVYAEHLEEDGLTPEMMKSVELIGRIFDHAQSQNSLYVFRTETKLTFAELLRHWNSSLDRKEHAFLVPFVDDPELILAAIEEKGYNPEKADQKYPSKTTLENVGRILPPAVASLQLHYQHESAELAPFRRETADYY